MKLTIMNMDGSATSFKIKEDTLEFINTKCTKSMGPCHLVTDLKREKLFVANYGEGSICVYNLDSTGEIEEMIYEKKYSKSKMHYIGLDNEYIYAVDLERDCIIIYNNTNEIQEEKIIEIENGAGPRHFVMNKEYMYVVTEYSNMIYVYNIKNNTEFELIQKISTTPEGAKEKTFAGAIKLSKNGQNLYVTNRGHNSISVFNIINNKLELVQNISCGGDFPRDIELNSSEEYLLVANQKSNNITILKRDLKNGKLVLTRSAMKMEKPTCIVSKKTS